jgi:hypothetical protein
MAIEGGNHTPAEQEPALPRGESLAETASTGIQGLGQIEDVDKGPLVVRGHHIKALQRFETSGASPEAHAATDARIYRTNTLIPGMGIYGRDVSGYSDEDLKKFQDGYKKFHEEYAQLAADDTVVFVAGGQKDGICESCVIGNHCDTNYSGVVDAGYLSAISKVTHDMGLGDDVRMVADVRGNPQEVYLSAETAKAVVKNFPTLLPTGNINRKELREAIRKDLNKPVY